MWKNIVIIFLLILTTSSFAFAILKWEQSEARAVEIKAAEAHATQQQRNSEMDLKNMEALYIICRQENDHLKERLKRCK